MRLIHRYRKQSKVSDHGNGSRSISSGRVFSVIFHTSLPGATWLSPDAAVAGFAEDAVVDGGAASTHYQVAQMLNVQPTASNASRMACPIAK